ncbi:MAG TPA: PKD domain-containing protein [Bryobacteraceae bacterium]|jgi:hypothetical protein|nr:PKD domain-containing protein [Bryobacteraceae bacterium]
MRNTSTATLAALLFATLATIGQAQGLSITNYQLVSSVQATATLTQLTYRADLLNGSTPWGSVTATAGTTDPFALRIVPSQNTLTFPAVAAKGQVTSTNTFAVLVSSPATSLDTSKISWTFQTTPQGPVANPGPDQSVAVGAKVIVNGSASTNPSGNGSLTYAWTFVSRPPGTSARLTSSWGVQSGFTVDVAGTFILSLTVSNGVASNTADVTISTFSVPPVANAGPGQFVNIGALVQLDGSGSTDLNGNLLSCKWTMTGAPANSAANLSDRPAVNPTFTADLPGTYTFQLVVNDGVSSSAPSTVTITTNPPIVPMAFAGQNRTVTSNTLVTLTGVGADPQGKPLVYTWTLLSEPPTSTSQISNTAIPQPTLVVNAPGMYVAQLVVSDGTQTSAPSTVTITTTNTAPVANAGPNQTVAFGRTVLLNGSGSFDVDGDPLTYSWTFTTVPAGSAATISGPASQFPNFTPDVPGLYVVQLMVSDPYQSAPPSTVSITIPTPVVITLTPSPLAMSSYLGVLTVSLSVPAGSNGAQINLVSSNTAAATVPPSVTVAPGASTAQIPVSPGNTGGSSTITASATSMTSGTATVNFTPIVITLSPNPLALAGLPLTMTVNLSAPAGPAGAVVSLTSSNTTAATVPLTVTVPAGAAMASATVTPGSASGATNITASSTSMISGTATVNYTRPPFLFVPANPVNVGVGQTTTFAVGLSIPAPAPNGTVISLVSSDKTKVKLPVGSVTVPAGATAPTTQPTIQGVSIGATTITVSATGFPTISQTANAVETLTFYPTSVSLPFPSTSNRYSWLMLSGNAPAGGLTVNLTSDNPAVATVPATITIPAGQTEVQVYVTGVANGTTTIHASLLPFIPDTTATVKIGP